MDPDDQAYALLDQGRPDEALAVIEPHALKPRSPHHELAAYAAVLKALGRRDEALTVYLRAVAIDPKSGVAEHNLAALQGDMNRYADAEASARRAMSKGLQVPETWLVLARAIQGQGRNDEAEAAYRRALAINPAMADAHGELAQLIWMRTEDAAAASRTLKAAVAAYPRDSILALKLAKALQYGGLRAEAYEVLLDAIARAPAIDPGLESAASILAMDLGKSVAAVNHAERGLTAAPEDYGLVMNACDAQLGVGRAGVAARLALDQHERRPDDQQVISRIATAWRMMDDPRYAALYDYDAMVRGWTIDTPEGWADLPAYLADLATALRAAHTVTGHPFGQSLRQGSQTHADLVISEDPAIQAFFKAIDGPIRRHMDWLGSGEDNLRRRNTGEYRIQGAWSVRLRPGGYHVDHVHPMGWLSSACHIVLPASVEGAGREGWLKFGEPGIPTQPKLGPEHFVRPETGRLVLFPSYMWHGTVPFTGDDERLSIAFDIVPG